MAVNFTEKAETARQSARQLVKEGSVEVMELRLFLKEGKILWVEPIDPENFTGSQATAEDYSVDIVSDLQKEKVRQVSPVAVQQSSPGCTYWYTIVTKDGITKICLYCFPMISAPQAFPAAPACR